MRKKKKAKGLVRLSYLITWHLALAIWVFLQSVDTPTKVHLMDNNDVEDLRREILRAFPTQLAGFGTPDLVVRAPTAPCPPTLAPRT